MDKKSKLIILFAIIAVLVVAAIVILLLPKDVFKSRNDSNTTTEAVMTFDMEPVRTDDEYDIMASKAQAYEDGDESVFESYEEYIRAKSYLKSYKDHEEAFGD